jgi:hypothetical protein
MALDQDFLTRVVNVHWGGGLAVEFGDKAEDAPKKKPPDEDSGS